MEDLEKQLAALKFARPPQWLKARALVAAQNARAPLMRRRRLVPMLFAAAAAVIFVVATAMYLLQAFGLLANPGSGALRAQPVMGPLGPADLNLADTQAQSSPAPNPAGTAGNGAAPARPSPSRHAAPPTQSTDSA